MTLPGWEELKDLITKIARLAGNVDALADRVKRNSDHIEKLNQEITELKADLRVARAELETSATQTAMKTVVQAHEQILTRVISLEQTNLQPRLDGKDDNK